MTGGHSRVLFTFFTWWSISVFLNGFSPKKPLIRQKPVPSSWHSYCSRALKRSIALGTGKMGGACDLYYIFPGAMHEKKHAGFPRMGSSPLKFDEGIYQNFPPSWMAIDLSKAHHSCYLFVKFRGCIPIWGDKKNANVLVILRDFPHLSKT